MPRRLKPNPQIPTYELVAVIRKGGKSPIRHEAWRYYSILDTLRWYGVDRDTAMDVAKWCGRAHEELSQTLTNGIKEEDITVTLERGK